MKLAHDLPDDDPTIAALGPDERALVARTWTERSACEQRAAVIFAIVARDLLVDGAAPEILDLATRAVHDELRHTEICREVASRYHGGPVPWPAPEPAPVPGFLDAGPELTRLLYLQLGVPRMKELQRITYTPKNASLTVALLPADEQRAERASAIAKLIQCTLLGDVVDAAQVLYDPDDRATLVPADAE